MSKIQDVLGYSLSEFDALYSGDQEQINRAFFGPLAFVNDADGETYSIYWLAEHTPKDNLAAGLPIDEVEAVIQRVPAVRPGGNRPKQACDRAFSRRS